ncbi:PAS domain-containing protein [uncultured Roseobacter sp.]|uniref:PAS domain-containing protein n=1 Tax=uncultured Roseobacter sp. TaxID=114847 RepID=UPI0026235E94|nr:PAS domain-containing protein [uncultured Roseobacter sp.]
MTIRTAPNTLKVKSVEISESEPARQDVNFDMIMAPKPRPQVTISKDEAQIFDVANQMKIPITFSDPSLSDCPIVFANRAFECLTGFPASMLVGSNCRFLQGGDTDRAEVAKIRMAVERCSPCDALLTNYKANGQPFNNLLVIRPIWLSNERCVLMGCQYEFNFGARRQEIERNCYSRFEASEEMSLKLRVLERISRESLLVRSDVAAVKIENYVMRKRAGL